MKERRKEIKQIEKRREEERREASLSQTLSRRRRKLVSREGRRESGRNQREDKYQ